MPDRKYFAPQESPRQAERNVVAKMEPKKNKPDLLEWLKRGGKEKDVHKEEKREGSARRKGTLTK